MPSGEKTQNSGASRGERRRVLAYLIVALFGAGLSFVAVTRLSGDAVIAAPLGLHDIWMVFSGAAGATAALYLVRNRMGLPGLSGLYQAALAVILISFIGALIAGTLALPVYGTMFGPFTLAIMFISSPLVAVLWAANLMGAHLLLTSWRAERESIF